MPGMMLRPPGEVHVVRKVPFNPRPLDPIPFDPEPSIKMAPQDEISFCYRDTKIFRLEKHLGMGGFGVTARVRVLKDVKMFRAGDIVVIKQLRDNCTKSERERFIDEYNIARNLGVHDNIVNTFTMSRDSVDRDGKLRGRLFLRYCNAGTLHSLIKQHKAAGTRLPEEFIWHVVEGMGYALARLHNGLHKDSLKRTRDWTGYTHYDIKPDNILLHWSHRDRNSKYPVAKLADFGCSARIGRKPDLIGHMLYRAPELCGSREKAFRGALSEADIFSLGVTIYEMCEGELPFRIDQVKKDGRITEVVNHREFRKMRSNYHPRLKTLIEWCLAPDYHKRPGAEDIFIECRHFKKEVSSRSGYRPGGSSRLGISRPR